MRILVSHAEGGAERLNEELGPVYLREGPIAWNLVDEDGPLEFDPEALLELPFEQAYIIADACDDLYTERVIAPLVGRMNGSSASTPTATTSRTSRSSRRHPPRAVRSSRATSAAGKKPVA